MKLRLMLAATAALALIACGKTNAPESTAPSGATGTAPAETTQPAQPETQPTPSEAQPAQTESQPGAAPGTEEQKEERKGDEQTPAPSEQK